MGGRRDREEGKTGEGQEGERRWGNKGTIHGGDNYEERSQERMENWEGGRGREGQRERMVEEERERKERKETITGSHGRNVMRNDHGPHSCIDTSP